MALGKGSDICDFSRVSGAVSSAYPVLVQFVLAEAVPMLPAVQLLLLGSISQLALADLEQRLGDLEHRLEEIENRPWQACRHPMEKCLQVSYAPMLSCPLRVADILNDLYRWTKFHYFG